MALTIPLGATTVVREDGPAPPPELATIPIALLLDLNAGRVIYSQADSRVSTPRFAPASIAKVMTVFVALEEMKAGRLSAARKMVVSDATARAWNGRGTSLYLKGGQEIDADTLLRGIATVSANDAAVVLAEGYAGDVAHWCALMNEHARRLGMANSHFATPNGWPDGGATYVSAGDLMTLAQALITRHPEGYRRYFGQKRMTFGGVEQQSHDPTIGVVRGADGIKTGHTNEAGYNFLGSAERDGRRLVMVVARASSEADRAAASRALLEWGFAEWESRPLFAAGKPVTKARVQGGAAREVSLVANQTVAATYPRGAVKPIALEVTYKGPLVAPIAKGAQVAELTIDPGGGRIPLFAAVSVDKAGPFDRLVNGLAGLVP